MENFNIELFANDLESDVGLTLVGGRPGVGKTTFLLNVTAQMLRRNKNVFFVSLELDEESVKNYLLSTGLNDQDSLSKLAIYDKPNFNIDDLSDDETVVNSDLIIIDYLNLISYANDKSLDYIVKQLKNILNHKNINIIASAQLITGNDESRIPTESDFMISEDVFSKYVDNSILLYEKKFYLIIRRSKMKRILSIVIGMILVTTVFAACSKEVNTDATATTDKSTTVQSDSSTEINTITTTESTTQSTSQATYKKNVIVSFNAVQGAVIYDQSYDLNGYLESCQFHKKCEACGYVSNSNGQARGNLSTSYHCTQCGNNQAVEIVANFECVEVSYDH